MRLPANCFRPPGPPGAARPPGPPGPGMMGPLTMQPGGMPPQRRPGPPTSQVRVPKTQFLVFGWMLSLWIIQHLPCEVTSGEREGYSKRVGILQFYHCKALSKFLCWLHV